MSRRIFLIETAKTVASAALLTQFSRAAVAHQNDGDAAAHQPIDHIHQIVIVDGYGMPAMLSEGAQERTRQLKACYPGAAHTLWTGAMLRELIAFHFGGEVVRAFDSLKPYAYKCDLARYCLLHTQGGLYSDLGIEHHAPWRIPTSANIAGFKEVCLEREARFDVGNSILWAKPHCVTLERAIDRVVENCRNRFIGLSKLDPTGPGLLGWAWASTYAEQWASSNRDHYLGLAEIRRTPAGTTIDYLPTATTRQPVARRPPRSGGDNRHLILGGTNNYADLWQARDIYN